MHVLGLDTSTELGSVALVSEGVLVAELAANVRAKHGETLLPNVAEVLRLGGIDVSELGLIACGRGPGSFTGLRIALATAKGLCFARNVPFVGITGLDALTAQVAAPAVVAVLDAHKQEVYAQLTVDGALRIPVFHASPEVAARRIRELYPVEPLAVTGDGASPAFLGALGAHWRAPSVTDSPRAAVIASLGLARFLAQGPDDVATVEPLYVRDADAKLPA